ncbi:MAG: M24 family metallopeptidase C-terminal domain-containing protein, partial [Burkholderiaceae bacterium]
VISWRAIPLPHMAMRAGMITSNEPGIYRAGQWGVRIENLVANVAAQTTALGEFLRFETLTLCPIDTRCVLPELMTDTELTWLNAYHAEVLARLSPLLAPDVQQWLQHRCQALAPQRSAPMG